MRGRVDGGLKLVADLAETVGRRCERETFLAVKPRVTPRFS